MNKLQLIKEKVHIDKLQQQKKKKFNINLDIQYYNTNDVKKDKYKTNRQLEVGVVGKLHQNCWRKVLILYIYHSWEGCP